MFCDTVLCLFKFWLRKNYRSWLASPPLKRANNDKVKIPIEGNYFKLWGLRVHIIQFPKNSILHDYKVHFIFWQLLLQLLYIRCIILRHEYWHNPMIKWWHWIYIFHRKKIAKEKINNLKHCILYLTGRKSHKDVFLYIVVTVQNMYVKKCASQVKTHQVGSIPYNNVMSYVELYLWSRNIIFSA